MDDSIPGDTRDGRNFNCAASNEPVACRHTCFHCGGFVLAVCGLLAWSSISMTCLGQDQAPRLAVFDEPAIVVNGESSLAAAFSERLAETAPLTIDDSNEEAAEPTLSDRVSLLNYLDGEEQPLSSLTADLVKRLTDVEKNLKRRDDADQKKAGEFPTFKVTGFLQLDTAYYDQTRKNIATVGNGQDGMGFRRARFAVLGKVAEFSSYQLEVDFATQGRPSFFDNYFEQGNVPFFGEIRAGQFLQPFSVDAMSGFRNLPFMERSLPFLAFVPFRRVGVMASNGTDDDRTHWAYSVFRTGGFANAPLGDSQFAVDTGDVGGYSFSTRVTQLLYYDEFAEDRYLWHVGASYDFSQLGANDALGGAGGNGVNAPFYQSKVLPEFGPLGNQTTSSTFGPTGTSASVGTPLFLDSGKYQAYYFQIVGVETVYQYGPLSVQSEYMATFVESVVGEIFYQGAYVEAMYRLTGEHRLYDKKLAALRNPVPYADFIPLKKDGVRGWGAWSVAARWSGVGMTNPNSLKGHYFDPATGYTSSAASASAGNGALSDITVGVTWHLNYHSKVQFNWIHAMLDNSAKGFSTADLFVGRVQVDF